MAAVLVFASCDTGGEPPTFDAGPDGGGPGDVTPTDSTQDSPNTDALDEATDGSTCGLFGLPCCVGDGGVTSCTEGKCTEVSAEKICEPPNCGTLGHPCCAAPENECATGQVCNLTDDGGGICGPCGGSGDKCCALNTCGGGGCCLSGYCTSAGRTCAETDAAVCSAGACGACGAPGSPCCSLGCTAPETICQGSIAAVDGGDGGTSTGGSSGACVSCGGCGQPCCSGTQGCAASLTCTSGICAALGDASCPDDGG
jgi:hypothetical protein